MPALAQEAKASPVRVDTVKAEPLSQTVPVIGRLVARQSGSVAAQIDGPIEEFRVEVGDRVEAGQVIAILNADKLKAQRDLAAGRLAEARAERATKKAQLDLKQLKLKRMAGLKTSAAFNQARFEDDRQEVAIAEAELRESDAAVASSKSDLNLAEINLHDTEIRAPYAGIVTKRLTEAGAYVQTGAAVVDLIGDKTLEIEADVPFQHLSGLTANTEVSVDLDDGTTHRATVRAVVPEENPLTRTRAVLLVPLFGETREPLADAQSVTLWVPVGVPRQIVSVHKDAIINRPGSKIVFVVEDGVALSRSVTLGVSVGSRFEVLSGLEVGDRVVVRGNERLRPNNKVQVIGES